MVKIEESGSKAQGAQKNRDRDPIACQGYGLVLAVIYLPPAASSTDSCLQQATLRLMGRNKLQAVFTSAAELCIPRT